MKRRIYKQLIEWKNDSKKKPLLLQGARQVGKTYIINEIAKNEYTYCVWTFCCCMRLFILLIFVVPNSLLAQELILDPSFEDTISCPMYLGDFPLKKWFKPHPLSSDLYCSCFTPDQTLIFEYKEAKDKDCFIGLLLHHPPS